MAPQSILSRPRIYRAEMIGHGYLAVDALHGLAAAPAVDYCRVPPPVQKQYSLIALVYSLLKRLKKLTGKNRFVPCGQLSGHIRYFNLGKRPPVYALG